MRRPATLRRGEGRVKIPFWNGSDECWCCLEVDVGRTNGPFLEVIFALGLEVDFIISFTHVWAQSD